MADSTKKNKANVSEVLRHIEYLMGKDERSTDDDNCMKRLVKLVVQYYNDPDVGQDNKKKIEDTFKEIAARNSQKHKDIEQFCYDVFGSIAFVKIQNKGKPNDEE